MENVAVEINAETWNWPEGMFPPPPPVVLEEDICYLSTGTTDEDWKFGTD